jgi:PAS domain S-box-containing protein
MSTQRRVLIVALALYSVVVCFLDVLSPLGLEVWVLNLPIIIVPMFFRNTRMVVVANVACTVTIVLGSILSPPGANPRSWDILNRAMGLVTVWLIAGMAINTIKRSQQLDEAVSSLKHEIEQHNRTSRSLELSEERLRLAVVGAGMGTVDVNVPTGKVYWSATQLRILGYETESGHETSIEMWHALPSGEDQARIEEAREEARLHRSLYAVEFRIKRVDNGDIRWIRVYGRWYYNESDEAIRFLAISFDITQRKELERQLLDITNETERSIGQELHDSVGQEITGLGLMAKTLAERLPEAGAERRLAMRLVAGLNQLHDQIRALAHGLIPVEMETKGLSAALDDLVASTREQTGVTIRFECPEWIEMPDHVASLELYRIAQEAISNALRHGRPRTIHVAILSQPEGLCLRIQDDGVGLAQQPKESKGLGIRIMEHRAALIGGMLRLKPAEEGGTVVTVLLPGRKANGHEECGTVAVGQENPDRG